MIIDYALLSSLIIESSTSWSRWTGQEINIFFAARSREDSGYYGTHYAVDLYMNNGKVGTFTTVEAVGELLGRMFPRKATL